VNGRLPRTLAAVAEGPGLIAVADLLVPAGRLRVVDTWQVITDEDAGPVGWLLTLRTPYLNGQPIWRTPETRDLLDSAADAIDGGLRLPNLRDTAPVPALTGT
jgi:hypothetical protein